MVIIPPEIPLVACKGGLQARRKTFENENKQWHKPPRYINEEQD